MLKLFSKILGEKTKLCFFGSEYEAESTFRRSECGFFLIVRSESLVVLGSDPNYVNVDPDPQPHFLHQRGLINISIIPG